MKFTKSFFTLPGAVLLLLLSFASIASAQSIPQQAVQPCINNPSLACGLFAAFDSNLSSNWYYNQNASPQSNGLGKDPVFMYVNGALVNGTSSLTNSSLPTQGLWVGLAQPGTTVSFLGGQGDNSTSFGTCTNNIYPNTLSASNVVAFGTQGNVYTFGTPYSCH
jgi:hypothetical protein